MGEYWIFDLSSTQKWQECFDHLPIEQQDIYYSPQYYSLFENNGDGIAQCFVYKKDEDVAIYPFLKNSINKLGFDLNSDYFDIQGAYGYNGIVSSSYTPSFISAFSTSFKNFIVENRIVAEFTRFHPVIQNVFFIRDLEVIQNRKTIVLEITKDYDFIWNNCYSGINRNKIRKALNNNVQISISDDESDFHSFYDIYRTTMENVGAREFYYLSEMFFQNLRTLLTSHQKLLLAKVEGKIVGAMILLFHGKYAHYFLSGRYPEFSHIASNNLILDAAIKISKNEGCSLFHFGGGTSNLSNDSLLKFKSGFSPRMLNFSVGKKVHNIKVYKEIVKQWKIRYPEKVEKYDNLVLKYRF